MKCTLADIVPRWNLRRRQPYSDTGIRRALCIRCSKPAFSQWQICADGRVYRPLCRDCDVSLNRMVLEWMRHPNATGVADRYAATLKD